MDIFQSLILGIIQGITEFLPISSSGHLILAPKIFGWIDQGLSFTVALHWGTLFGVIGYFYRDWLQIFSFAFRKNKKVLTVVSTKVSTFNNNILLFIIVATIPGAIAGYFLEDLAETIFRNPILVASTLIGAGVILYFADRFGKKYHKINNITLKTALIIGFAQALAIVPGVSRSGITISAALFLGLNRKDSAHFSFLLAAPIILGAGLIKISDIISSGIDAAFIVGFLASAVAGFLSIKWLLKYVESRSYFIFVVYRMVLGALILLLFI